LDEGGFTVKKITLAFLILLCAGAPVFSGGGRQDQGQGGSRETLAVLVGRSTRLDGLQKVFDEIEKRYNIVSEIEVRQTGAEGETLVKTRLASNSMADIFNFNTGSKINDIQPERYCMDLSEYKPKLVEGYITASSVNGKLYSFPLDYASYAGIVMYHKGIYQKLGLQIPKTWKEFLANCDKIQAAGITAVLGAVKDTWTAQMFFLGDEYNVEAVMPDWPRQYTANKAKYATTPPALRSFQKLADVSKYLNKDYLATTMPQGLEMLVKGEAAHFAMQAHRLAAIEMDYPDKIGDIGIFPVPGDDPDNMGITAWMPNGWFINKEVGQNPAKLAAVKKWIDFFLSQDAWKLFTSVQKPGGPAMVKGFDMPADVIPGIKEQQQYYDSGRYKLALEFVSPIKGPNLEQFCIEVLSGRMNPADAAKAYDQDVQKQAYLLNLPGW
jgi:raffinose/stachyose/melibiose transport system substrate-binding protein